MAGGSVGHWIWSALRLAEVRLRVPIVLVVAAVVIGRWEVIRNYWDRFTRSSTAQNTFKLPISSDTEYFCPMDPGVVSHGPARCGVCNMALVRRKRGDAVMLPDGVVARMQLSPYRIQLAGIQTAPLGYLPLNREWSAAGLVTREADDSVTITMDVPGRQAPWVEEGQRVDIACADLPGQWPLTGRIRSLPRRVVQGREFARVTVAIEKPPQTLRGGMIAVVTFRIAMAALDPFRTMPSGPPARKRGEPGASTSVTITRRRSPSRRDAARSTARTACRRRWVNWSGCNGGVRCIRRSPPRMQAPFANHAAGWS